MAASTGSSSRFGRRTPANSATTPKAAAASASRPEARFAYPSEGSASRIAAKAPPHSRIVAARAPATSARGELERSTRGETHARSRYSRSGDGAAGNRRGARAVLRSMPATAAHLLCLRDDARLTARPIRPDDKDALVAFFARLSPESRRRRFLAPKPRLTARDLVLLTEVDGRAHVALVALDREGAIVGVARYAGWPDCPERADVAFAVADDWHGRGLGTVLG